MSVYFANIKPQQLKDTSPTGKTCQDKVLHLSMNAIASRIANTRADGSIRVWKITSQGPSDCVQIKSGHAEPVERVSWHPSTDNRFASVGGDAIVKVWTLAGVLEREVHLGSEKGEEKFRLVDYSVDGLYLSVVDGSRLLVLDVKNGYQKLHEETLASVVSEVKWLYDQNTVLVGLQDGRIVIFRVGESLEQLAMLLGARLAVNSIAIDPKGRVICAGCEEGIVYFWRTSDLQNSQALTKIDESVTCVDINRDGNYLAVSYAKDSNTRIYDVGTLQQVHEIPDTASKTVGSSLIKWLPNLTGYIYTADQTKLVFYAKKLV